MIQEKELRLQMIDAYKEGVKALEEGDVLFAAKKFNEAEAKNYIRRMVREASIYESKPGYYNTV